MVLHQGHPSRDCNVIYLLDKYEASYVAVAVSPGGCVLSWLWTFTLQLFLVWGFFLIMVGGILRMFPRIIYIQYIYIFFRALNVSWDSSEDVKKTLSRYTDKYAFSVYRLACRHTFTHTSFENFRPKPGGISLPCRVIYTEGVRIWTDTESDPVPDLFHFSPTVFPCFVFVFLFCIFF